LLINSLALEAGQQGTFVVDGSALLGLPGNPMTLDPRYTNEGVHPNDAGHAVMAGVFVPMLKKMFGI
jgi:lysophospholipase L1-like esterase